MISKKGIVDDWFDFMFIVVVSLLVYFFLYSSLMSSVNNGDYIATTQTTDFEVYHNSLLKHQEELEKQKETIAFGPVPHAKPPT